MCVVGQKEEIEIGLVGNCFPCTVKLVQVGCRKFKARFLQTIARTNEDFS